MDPFQDCPVFQMQLVDDDGGTMASNLDALLDAVVHHIRNNIWVAPNGLVEGIPSLQKGAGHYIIELLPPAHWTQNNIGSCRLLFDFDNLYFVGFDRNRYWFLFDEEYKKMEHLHQGSNLRSLGFGSNYNNLGATFKHINISIYTFIDIYRGISGYPGSSIKELLMMTALCFSETIRFPRFREYALNRITTFASNHENIERFSVHFREWSVYCLSIRLGEEAFDRRPGIETFADLLALIGMVL